MVNFSEINVPSLEGENQIIDVKKQLGNALYYQSQDLEGSELGRKIYFAEDEIELTESEIKIVKDMIPNLFTSYVIQKSIIDSLN